MAAWPSAWADRQSPHWAAVQLALPGSHPTPAHPIWPRQAQESGRLPPVVRAEPHMTRVPSRSLSIRWERPPAERPLSSPLHGPLPESAVYDNPSSLAGRSAFRALHMSTHPHGNSGKTISHNVSGRRAKSCQFWNDGETFWVDARARISHLLIFHWPISSSADFSSGHTGSGDSDRNHLALFTDVP